MRDTLYHSYLTSSRKKQARDRPRLLTASIVLSLHMRGEEAPEAGPNGISSSGPASLNKGASSCPTCPGLAKEGAAGLMAVLAPGSQCYGNRAWPEACQAGARAGTAASASANSAPSVLVLSCGGWGHKHTNMHL